MPNQYALDIVCSAKWVLEGSNNIRIVEGRGIIGVEVTDSAQFDFIPDNDNTVLETDQVVFCQQATGIVALLGSVITTPAGLRVRVVSTAGPTGDPLAGQMIVFPVQGRLSIVGTIP